VWPGTVYVEVVLISPRLRDTRLKKLDDPNGPFTAIILAAAGMNRMGWQDRITAVIKAPEMLYAVGQGALALEIRSGDERVKTALQDVGNWKSEWSTAAERGLLRELEGGCSVPVGVEAFIEEVDEAASKSINRPFDKDPEAPSDTAPLLHRSGKGKMAKLHMTACVTSLDGKTQVLHDAGEILVKSYLEADSWGHKVALTLKEKGATSILDEINQLRKEREREAALAQGKGSQ
jgi:hydroxymethylbilane synthase